MELFLHANRLEVLRATTQKPESHHETIRKHYPVTGSMAVQAAENWLPHPYKYFFLHNFKSNLGEKLVSARVLRVIILPSVNWCLSRNSKG